MSNEKMKELISKRLADWGAACLANESTPAVLLAVGHNQHKQSIAICSQQELPAEKVAALLEMAAARLRASGVVFLPEPKLDLPGLAAKKGQCV